MQADVDFWARVARGEAGDLEVREFFCAGGCTAAVDFPAALYYRKLIEEWGIFFFLLLYLYRYFQMLR